MATKKSELSLETIAILREKLKEAETTIKGWISYSVNFEDRVLMAERRAEAAENQAKILYDGVRILANALSNKTTTGRAARTETRKLLEKNRILPPKTLGASRNRPKGGKKKKA